MNSKTFQNTHSFEIDVMTKHCLSTQPLNATSLSNRTIPIMYWLHKQPFKFFLSVSKQRSTTKQKCVPLANAITTVKHLVTNFYDKVNENSGVSHFWSFANFVINKFKKECHFYFNLT